MQAAAAENWKYADPENHDLRAAIARFHGVTPANVVIGEGIDGLLGLACTLAVDSTRTVVTSDGAYPTFNFHVAGHGGRLVRVPYRNDREDLAGLRDVAERERASVLYVSNPDNPMGTWWSAADVTRLIERLPDGLLFLLRRSLWRHRARRNAATNRHRPTGRVLRFRTLSKAYGLAGARIGYALGEAGLIAEFEKVRNHYGINRVGQIGALAAIEDQDYLADAVLRIARARDRIATIAAANGLLPLPSATNFVAIDCGGDGAFAKRVLDGLIARDVFVRKPMAPGLDRCIRVSCGLDADLDVFANAAAGGAGRGACLLNWITEAGRSSVIGMGS